MKRLCLGHHAPADMPGPERQEQCPPPSQGFVPWDPPWRTAETDHKRRPRVQFNSGEFRMKITALVSTGAIVLTTALSAGAALVPAASASASRTPVAYGVPYGVPYGSLSGGSNFVHAKVRPTGKLYWTGDGSAWFSRMRRWASWSASGARGSATAKWLSANRKHVYATHAALHFYRIRTHQGHPYFTRLHFSVIPGHGLKSATLKFFPHGLAWYYATAAANAPAASASSRTPVAYELRADGVHAHHVVRPRTFHLMVGGPNVKVIHLHWSSWGSHRARGTGHAYGRDLHGWESIGRVTIIFSDVQRGCMCSPVPFFEKLHLIGGRNIIHRWHWEPATAVLPAGWQG